MRRAFLSLYGLIVISVIAIGWGLDRLWNYYQPSDVGLSTNAELIVALGFLLDSSETALDHQLAELQRQKGLDIRVISREAFAQSKFLAALEKGEPVEVRNSADTLTLYQLLPQKKSVLRLQIPHAVSGDPIFYDLLLVGFYGSLALVVFLWMWPLSRDLAKLEKQTRMLGKEALPPSLHIGPASAVYDLATAFKRMSERIQELLASHKEMTYAVSHELRTPLARMKFALEIAATHQDADKIHQKLMSVREDVSEMDALVNQLLAYAGFEQGENVMNFQPGDLNAMVGHLTDRIQQLNPNRPSNIEVQCSLLGSVRCEWCLMERAIHNLLMNAQRFARTRVLVTLSDDDQNVIVTVHDDGPGVPEADRKRVLHSFVRLTNHTNSQVRGFGLGLAIVQRVMTWHKGTVEITESTLGGAAVTLRWPKDIG